MLESRYGKRPKYLPMAVRLALGGVALLISGLVVYSVAKLAAVLAVLGIIMFFFGSVLALQQLGRGAPGGRHPCGGSS